VQLLVTGGAGVATSITGSSVTYAGGGGGGSFNLAGSGGWYWWWRWSCGALVQLLELLIQVVVAVVVVIYACWWRWRRFRCSYFKFSNCCWNYNYWCRFNRINNTAVDKYYCNNYCWHRKCELGIMAHYAFLDENNVVTEVITGIDETELIEGLDTETWYGNFRGQTCKRTSYNGKYTQAIRRHWLYL
jgi:hypothetical protein